MLHQALELGFNVLVMDVDFAVLRNPFIYLQSVQPACDLTFYEDLPLPIIQGNSWIKRGQRLLQLEVNTGFFFVRSTLTAKKLVKEFLEAPAIVGSDGVGADDQLEFNKFMISRASISPQASMLLPMKQKAQQCAEWKGVSLHLLSPVLFGSWNNWFVLNVAEWTQESPYAIHYNMIVGYENKKAKMVEHGFWLVDL